MWITQNVFPTEIVVNPEINDNENIVTENTTEALLNLLKKN